MCSLFEEFMVFSGTITVFSAVMLPFVAYMTMRDDSFQLLTPLKLGPAAV